MIPLAIFGLLDRGNTLPAEQTTAMLSQENIKLPVRLKIPKINVDAAIEYVGVTPLQAMDTPKDPINAAWFELGRRPGEIGSAVIAGHYGPWKTGQKSVFDDLNKLSAGDKLYIHDDKDGVIAFVVREIRTYTKKQDATDVFSSDDGKAHLNLITCEGIWNEAKESYPSRLIIFADKE